MGGDLRNESDCPPAETEDSNGMHAVSDQATSEDLLGFRPYVLLVKRFLTHPNTETPLTLSVEGQWGVGKSSFLKQLQSSVQTEGVQTVWFNPWRHEDEEALWAAFILDFLDQIRNQQPWWRRIYGDALLFKRRLFQEEGITGALRVCLLSFLVVMFTLLIPFVFITYGGAIISSISSLNPDDRVVRLVSGSSGVAVAVVSVLTVWGAVKDRVLNPLAFNIQDYAFSDTYEGRVSFISDIHDDFDYIVNAYTGDDDVFIFVDDLDRCEIPKAADLMQSIHLLLANNSHLVFVLAIDREKVAAGIAAKYSDYLPYLSSQIQTRFEQIDDDIDYQHIYGVEYGFRYLEKFIQVPFLVPTPNENHIDDFVDRLIQPEQEDNEVEEMDIELSEIDYDDFYHVVDFVSSVLEYNPRMIKKFVNLYRLRIMLAQKDSVLNTDKTAGEARQITLEQLGKFVAISLRWPRLLSQISEDSELLVQLENFAVGTVPRENVPRAVRSWTRHKNLITLLRHGCEEIRGDQVSPELIDLRRINRFSFFGADIDALLQISPRVDSPTSSESMQRLDDLYSKSYELLESQEEGLSADNFDTLSIEDIIGMDFSDFIDDMDFETETRDSSGVDDVTNSDGFDDLEEIDFQDYKDSERRDDDQSADNE